MCSKNSHSQEDKVLIIGADGLVGSALSNYLKQKRKNYSETTCRKNGVFNGKYFLDLSKDVSQWKPSGSFSAAFFCAAISSLDYCRREPVKSARVNIFNTVKLAERLVKNGTFVVFCSTNLVYDGSIPFAKAESPVSPQTEHGRQKAEAERQLLALGDLISVVRFTKIFGPEMALFQDWILKLKDNQTINPLLDKRVSPLSLSLIVRVFYQISENRLPGIFQVSGSKDVTYAEIAYYIAKRLKADPKLVKPIYSRSSNLDLESVPAHTTLDSTRLARELGIKIPNVWNTIDLMVKENIETMKQKKLL